MEWSCAGREQLLANYLSDLEVEIKSVFGALLCIVFTSTRLERPPASLMLVCVCVPKHPSMYPCIPARRACSGRKKACLLYVMTYVLSCITKHSRSYYMLLAGRALGGVSTSLLFSAFESWVVSGGWVWV